MWSCCSCEDALPQSGLPGTGTPAFRLAQLATALEQVNIPQLPARPQPTPHHAHQTAPVARGGQLSVRSEQQAHPPEHLSRPSLGELEEQLNVLSVADHSSWHAAKPAAPGAGMGSATETGGSALSGSALRQQLEASVSEDTQLDIKAGLLRTQMGGRVTGQLQDRIRAGLVQVGSTAAYDTSERISSGASGSSYTPDALNQQPQGFPQQIHGPPPIQHWPAAGSMVSLTDCLKLQPHCGCRGRACNQSPTNHPAGRCTQQRDLTLSVRR